MANIVSGGGYPYHPDPLVNPTSRSASRDAVDAAFLGSYHPEPVPRRLSLINTTARRHEYLQHLEDRLGTAGRTPTDLLPVRDSRRRISVIVTTETEQGELDDDVIESIEVSHEPGPVVE